MVEERYAHVQQFVLGECFLGTCGVIVRGIQCSLRLLSNSRITESISVIKMPLYTLSRSTFFRTFTAKLDCGDMPDDCLRLIAEEKIRVFADEPKSVDRATSEEGGVVDRSRRRSLEGLNGTFGFAGLAGLRGANNCASIRVVLLINSFWVMSI
jgi:hypothetical protein